MALFNLFSQSPLTLRDLVNVDSGRVERSQLLSVNLDKVYYRVKKESLWDKIRSLFKRNNTSINMYYVILKFSVFSPSGNTYNVIIEFQPNPNLNNLFNNRVRVYCDCPSFKFQSAYLLNKKGSLFRSSKTDVKLGQAITDAPDPRRTKTSTICKHTLACIRWISDNINYVMKLV